MDILNVHLDNSLGTTQCRYSTRPPLDIGGCLWHTASFSWRVPQGAGPVSLQAHVSFVPGSARLPWAGPCFMCLPSQSPPPDPWAKSFKKWDFSLYYQTGVRTRTPRSEACGKGRRDWPPVCETTPYQLLQTLARFGETTSEFVLVLLGKLQSLGFGKASNILQTSCLSIYKTLQSPVFSKRGAGHTHTPSPSISLSYKTSHSGFSVVILAWTFKRILE